MAHHASAWAKSSKRSGYVGEYLAVLNCDSENGWSLTAPRQHPRDDVATKQIELDVQRIAFAVHRALAFGDIPHPHRIGRAACALRPLRPRAGTAIRRCTRRCLHRAAWRAPARTPPRGSAPRAGRRARWRRAPLGGRAVSGPAVAGRCGPAAAATATPSRAGRRAPQPRLLLLPPDRQLGGKHPFTRQQRPDLAGRATLRHLLHQRRPVVGGKPPPPPARRHLRQRGHSCILRLLSCHRTNLQCPRGTSLIRRGISFHTTLAGGALNSDPTILSVGRLVV